MQRRSRWTTLTPALLVVAACATGPSARAPLEAEVWAAPLGSATPPTDWPSSLPVPELPAVAFIDDAEFVEALEAESYPPSESTSPLTKVAISPSGELAVSGSGAGTAVWRLDPRTGRVFQIAALPGHRQGPDVMAWHSDERHVVTGAYDGQLRLWRLESVGDDLLARPVARVSLGAGNYARSAVFVAEDTLWVGDRLGRLAEWKVDRDRGALTYDRDLIPPVDDAPWSNTFALSPDRRQVLVGQTNGAATLWTLDGERRPVASVHLGAEAPVASVAFSSDGKRIALGGGDQDHGYAAIWELSTGSAPRLVATPTQHVRGNTMNPLPIQIKHVAFLDDDLITVSGVSIKRWRLTSPPTIAARWDGTGSRPIFSASTNAAGRWLVAGIGGALRLWRLDADPPAVTLVGPDIPAHERRTFVGDEFGPSPRRLIGSPFGPLPDEVHTGFEDDLARSPDGRWLATDSAALLWSCVDGMTRPVVDLGRGVSCVAFSPDSNWLLTSREDGVITTWRLGARVDDVRRIASTELREHDDVARISVGPRGLVLAAGQNLEMFRIGDDGLLTSLIRWRGQANTRMSRDGRWLLECEAGAWPSWLGHGVAARPGARLWRLDMTGDRPTRTLVARLGTDGAQSGAFSGDGEHLVTSHQSGTVRLWRLDPAGVAHPWPVASYRARDPYARAVEKIAFSPDGALVIGGTNPTLVWRILGRQQVQVGEDVIRWDRPRAAPPGAPTLRAVVEREGSSLTVRVSNEGDAAAYEVLGHVTTVDDLAPLGTTLPVAIGTVEPGASVLRRVRLPDRAGVLIESITWTDRWGRAPASGPPPTADADAMTLRRRTLRRAARAALVLTDPFNKEWLVGGLADALARDGDHAAALQMLENGPTDGRVDFDVRHRIALARAEEGDATGAHGALGGALTKRWYAEEVDMVLFLATLDRLDLYAAAVKARDVMDSWTRTWALSRLAARAREAGRTELAFTAMTDALESANGLEDDDARFLALRRLLKTVETDEASARLAIQTLERATWVDPNYPADAMRLAAAACARLGDHERAVALFSRAMSLAEQDPRGRNAQLVVVRALTRVGLVDEACHAIATLRQGVEWHEHADLDSAMLEAAQQLIEVGRIDDAVSVVTEIDQFRQYGDEGLLEASIALAMAGRASDALALAPRFHSHSIRAAAILEVARVEAEAGDDSALRTADGARFLEQGWADRWMSAALGSGATTFDPFAPLTWGVIYDRMTSLTSISSAHHAACARQLANAAVRLHVRLGLANPERYATAFDRFSPEMVSGLANGQASVGDVHGALEWAERLTDPSARVAALLGVGEALLPPPPPDLESWEAYD